MSNNFRMAKRRKLFSLLVDLRIHFLEFLRNLTPQVIIFSLVFLVARNLDFTKFDISNAPATLLFFILLAIGVYSVWANSTIFFERAMLGKLPFKRSARLLRYRGFSGVSLIFVNLKFAYRVRKLLFLELVLCMIIVQIGVVLVSVLALRSMISTQ